MNLNKIIGGAILVVIPVIALTSDERAEHPNLFFFITTVYLVLSIWAAIKLLRMK